MMSIKLKLIVLQIVLLMFISCDYFSGNKEEDKQKRVDSIIKAHKQKRLLEVNKDYDFILKSIAYKNSFSRDTVGLILKEYYKHYEGYFYNNEKNKLDDVEESEFLKDEIHKLDFIKLIVSKYNINEKSAYLIFYEIKEHFTKEDIMLSIDDIEDNIWSIENSIENIDSKIAE